jgi:polyisoprenoid-binding protein YceI
VFKKIALAALFTVSLPFTAQAAEETYTLDKAHTQIMFQASHLGFSTSTGRFMDFDGAFTFDTTVPEKSHVEVTIKPDSIEMGDQKWNDHLKGADFFYVTKFPAMTFKSTGIKQTATGEADITGDLTMHGVTKPVTLHVVHNKSGVHPFNQASYIAGFTATGTLDRADFGMTYGVPLLDTKVQLMIAVEGVRQAVAGSETVNQ